ncbi:alkyl hydroperoxide reductase AhpD [Novosphingobium sediminis]|uniref:Alkyl hydroperoxide reductase AhpD n=1 Tax=Novosphingobium sediminis TaxID=707214 RepID=A0A512ANB3_9SPHN|nr:carboxymuconolactone decarboxylase family protein [Novosphingobium sediminis]GEO01203.1 alkyl hydroperoxide reductase AhpD [Novosphingobium sediminis]
MSARLDYAAASPAGVKALGHVYGHILQSELDAGLVDLVYLRISQINGCAFCIDMHTRDLGKRGVAPEKLALLSVWREAEGLFTLEERAALAWAESVTLVADTGVPDADFTAASAVFSGKTLTDLTIAIGLMNTYNRLGIAFRAVPGAVAALAAAA